MYVKVYIARMKMTQRIHFWHPNLLKITIVLRKWQKNHFFGQKAKTIIGQSTTRNFELKMLKLNENHLKINV